MDNEQIKADTRNNRRDPNLGGIEPVFEWAAIKHHLQRPDGDAQCYKTEKVEGFAMGVTGITDKNQDAEAGDQPDGQVDLEDPAPAIVLGQPAAQHRAKYRPQHDPGAPDRYRLAVALRRVDLHQHRLGQRHEPGAAGPLQQAVDHQLRQTGSAAAKGTAGHRYQKYVLVPIRPAS